MDTGKRIFLAHFLQAGLNLCINICQHYLRSAILCGFTQCGARIIPITTAVRVIVEIRQ